MKKMLILSPTVAVFTLVLLFSSFAYGQQQENTIYLPLLNNAEATSQALPDPQPEFPQVPIPIDEMVTIRGTIISSNKPITIARLSLYRSTVGTTSSALIETLTLTASATQSLDYSFAELPRLQENERYNISYTNFNLLDLFGDVEPIPGFLLYWNTHAFETPSESSEIIVPVFDIADVTFRAPSDGATKSLPENFKWNERAMPTDRYRLGIYGTGDYLGTSAYTELLPHPTDNFDVGDINNAGFQTDVEYRWAVYVYDEFGGFGRSRESRRITFSGLR